VARKFLQSDGRVGRSDGWVGCWMPVEKKTCAEWSIMVKAQGEKPTTLQQ